MLTTSRVGGHSSPRARLVEAPSKKPAAAVTNVTTSVDNCDFDVKDNILAEYSGKKDPYILLLKLTTNTLTQSIKTLYLTDNQI